MWGIGVSHQGFSYVNNPKANQVILLTIYYDLSRREICTHVYYLLEDGQPLQDQPSGNKNRL
jgi:hypothetical protein